MKVLPCPVVFENPALKPLAVLQQPVVVLLSAWRPLAVLAAPRGVLWSARAPPAGFLWFLAVVWRDGPGCPEVVLPFQGVLLPGAPVPPAVFQRVGSLAVGFGGGPAQLGPPPSNSTRPTIPSVRLSTRCILSSRCGVAIASP